MENALGRHSVVEIKVNTNTEIIKLNSTKAAENIKRKKNGKD